MSSHGEFTSGGVPQRVVEVRVYDHPHLRVEVVCEPDHTPRWVSLEKVRVIHA